MASGKMNPMDQMPKIGGRPASRRLKLTEEVVAKIAPGERVYDTGVPGFFALGLKEGVSFRVLADIPAAARRWGMPKRTVERTVGRWSPNKRTGNLTPKAARTIADNFVAAIKKGEDPSPKVATISVTGWTIEQGWLAYRNGFLAKEGASEKTIRTYEFAFKLAQQARARWIHSNPASEIGKVKAPSRPGLLSR
jgi:hypothetical protein